MGSVAPLARSGTVGSPAHTIEKQPSSPILNAHVGAVHIYYTPLRVYMSGIAVLVDICSVGGIPISIDEHSGSYIFELIVVAHRNHFPFRIGMGGVAPLAYRGSIRSAAHPVEKQTGGSVFDLVGSSASRTAAGIADIGIAARTRNGNPAVAAASFYRTINDVLEPNADVGAICNLAVVQMDVVASREHKIAPTAFIGVQHICGHVAAVVSKTKTGIAAAV